MLIYSLRRLIISIFVVSLTGDTQVEGVSQRMIEFAREKGDHAIECFLRHKMIVLGDGLGAGRVVM